MSHLHSTCDWYYDPHSLVNIALIHIVYNRRGAKSSGTWSWKGYIRILVIWIRCCRSILSSCKSKRSSSPFRILIHVVSMRGSDWMICSGDTKGLSTFLPATCLASCTPSSHTEVSYSPGYCKHSEVWVQYAYGEMCIANPSFTLYLVSNDLVPLLQKVAHEDKNSWMVQWVIFDMWDWQ